MAKIDIKNYQIKISDYFFFDTNVWILLFGTIANYQKVEQKIYSKFLQDLISKNSPIVITSMVLSEFANVLLRHDFKQWETVNQFINKNFKRDFVGTSDYNDSVNNITQLIENILKIPNIMRISDNFHNIDIQIVLSNFGKVDYNDSYVSCLSQMNNYKIVTNDNDFQILSSNLDIITSQI